MAQKRMDDKSKSNTVEQKKRREEAWSYINIEHITNKSDGSLLQGVITEQDK